MTQTSAYRTRIRTDSLDENGLLLLIHGELVAILVQLDDDCHGEERGRWIIEANFGVGRRGAPACFLTAAEAADWISNRVSRQPFMLKTSIVQLS